MEQTTELKRRYCGVCPHLDDNKDVQNIDLMNLAGFAGITSKWYRAPAGEAGVEISDERELIYGMPYQSGKKKFVRGVKRSISDIRIKAHRVESMARRWVQSSFNTGLICDVSRGPAIQGPSQQFNSISADKTRT